MTRQQRRPEQGLNVNWGTSLGDFHEWRNSVWTTVLLFVPGRCRCVWTLRHQCRYVLRTLRHWCRSVLGPKCLGSEVSVLRSVYQFVIFGLRCFCANSCLKQTCYSYRLLSLLNPYLKLKSFHRFKQIYRKFTQKHHNNTQAHSSRTFRLKSDKTAIECSQIYRNAVRI